MAQKGIVTQYNGKPNGGNIIQYEVSTTAQVAMLPTQTKKASGDFVDDISFKQVPAFGSTCIVINGGDLLVYKLDTNGWVKC